MTASTELAAVQEDVGLRLPAHVMRWHAGIRLRAGGHLSDTPGQGRPARATPAVPAAKRAQGFRTRGGVHVHFNVVRRGLLAAGSFAFADRRRRAGCRPSRGFSPMDKTKADESKQDGNLKPHPTPPIAPSADKLPIDKIKLPSGFKAEVWSSGHPGARTMVMGDKGTMFMGTRVIGRVYAITDKDGKREAKVHHPGPDAAERPRLQGRLALRVRDQQGVPLRQHRGQSRQARRSRSN